MLNATDLNISNVSNAFQYNELGLYNETSLTLVTKYVFSPLNSLFMAIGILIFAALLAYWFQYAYLSRKFPGVEAHFNFKRFMPRVGTPYMWKLIGRSDELFIRYMSFLVGFVFILLGSMADSVLVFLLIPYYILMFPETKDITWSWLKARIAKKAQITPTKVFDLDVYEAKEAKK